MAWQFKIKVDRSRAFEGGQVLLTVCNQFIGQGRPDVLRIHGLDDRLYLFSKVFIGHADDRDIQNFGVSNLNITLLDAYRGRTQRH